jgi:hypothetical protein
MINDSKMVINKSQANSAIDDGTNNQATMASIEETEVEHSPTNEKTTEKEEKIGKDGKRRRIIVDLAESPNRRSPKLLISDDDAMEEDNVDLNSTHLGNNSVEEIHEEENEVAEEH